MSYRTFVGVICLPIMLIFIGIFFLVRGGSQIIPPESYHQITFKIYKASGRVVIKTYTIPDKSVINLLKSQVGGHPWLYYKRNQHWSNYYGVLEYDVEDYEILSRKPVDNGAN